MGSPHEESNLHDSLLRCAARQAEHSAMESFCGDSVSRRKKATVFFKCGKQGMFHARIERKHLVVVRREGALF